MGGRLFASGRFTSMDGVRTGCVAVWDGARWESLGDGVEGGVGSLAFHADTLFVAGEFRIGSSTEPARIARWDGTSWEALPDIPGVDAIYLAVDRGILYAGVDPQATIEETYYVDLFAYEAGAWQPVLSQPVHGWIPEYCCDGVRGLRVFDSRFYVFGRGVNDYGEIAVFDGAAWASVPFRSVNLWEAIPVVKCVTEWRDVIVAGGWFALAPRPYACNIAIRVDGVWEALGSGIGEAHPGSDWPDGTVSALAEYQGDLYVAGAFNQAGGKPSSNIARWIP
jgi:hypothetical protein